MLSNVYTPKYAFATYAISLAKQITIYMYNGQVPIITIESSLSLKKDISELWNFNGTLFFRNAISGGICFQCIE